MWLNVVWYILFVIIIAGYLILDGFDLGVGILHLFVAKDDQQRRVLLNSIGPIWNGNEVWLVVGGGALFAAFPLVYASLFSGMYLAMMLVLLTLILRAAAIEFRSKRESQGWRRFWDFIFFLSSLLIAVLLGVAFGNVLGGVPLDAQGNMAASLLSLLTPYAVLLGVTTVTMMAMHGAVYLSMKTEGELLQRVKRYIPRLIIAFIVLNTITVFSTVALHRGILQRYMEQLWPVIFPAGALAAVILAWSMIRRERYFAAFLSSSAMVLLLILSAAAGLFPNLLISTIDQANSLTIYNAAAAANTLTVMLVMAVIGMPLVILYTAGVYYIFRGRVKVGPSSY